MSQKLQAPRGTRDFYPEELRLRSWLFGHFRAVAAGFGFEEVDAPIVEHEELFTRKAGEEIVEQLYHFELHGRRLALRPEMTPSIARMVMARAGGLKLPLRWFTVTQNWRYERMTRGRRREHYQWNMDVWGEPGPAAEAELIAAIFGVCDRIGLAAGEVRVRISSRALLEETLRRSVLTKRPEAFEPLCVVIDKLDKIGRDAVLELLTDASGPVALPKPDAVQVVDWLGLDDLDAAAQDLPADSQAVAQLRTLQELLAAYGVADRVDFDTSIVRGLAYYTGIVFEAFDAGRKLRAICGGGRYDRLLETLGGPSIPAAGFGFGDVVVLELLADLGRLPELARRVDAVVFPFSEAERPQAVRLATALRGEGQTVELALSGGKLKRALADADRAGARRIFILGPDEVARGEALVRDLETGEQDRRSLS
ncbi:MAG: histidine--tRNA ligase [Myxococcota bacterium]|nr:histidine--tRNA ligase [Myxococcota bacterium]